MKINTFLLLFVLTLYSCNRGQQEKDSPEKKLSVPTVEDSLDALYYNTGNSENSVTYREQLFDIADRYNETGKIAKHLQVLRSINNLAAAQQDSMHLAKAYRYIGDYYESVEITDSAFHYYVKSEQLYRLTKKDSVEWGRLILYKAGILYDIGITSESEIEVIKALRILTPKNETRLIYEANVQMTLTLKELEEYDAALKYYDKIPVLLDKLQEEGYDEDRLKRSWLSYYNNMGGYYDKMTRFKTATEYYREALRKDYVDDYPKLYAMLLNNYAYNLMNTGGDVREIDSLLLKALSMREKMGYRQGIIASKFRMAEFLLSQKDTLKALEFMRDAYALSVEEKSHFDMLRTLEFLSKNDFKHKGQYNSAYVKVKDSLYELERKTRNKFARIAYETNEIEAQNIVLIQRNTYLWLIAGFLFLVSAAVFIVLRLRLRNRKLQQLHQEQESIQQIQDLLLRQQTITNDTRNQERERIAKDLHDAVINRVFTTRINLEQLLTDQPQQKVKLIEELKQTEQQIREISHDLHENLFHHKQDFSAVIEELVLKQKNVYETLFECSIDRQINWDILSIGQKTQLYLILQELLQNVNKHAQAQKCYVFIMKKQEQLVLRVHDDGIGLDAEKVKGGLGFKSIGARVKKLNGTFKIGAAGQMTTIIVTIPLT